ncbi:MAG: cation:proton antiporter [Candidatus Marsarchaeota archaeon]|nr:cation:proton antiporter [Candidatus Marsarchaeota archaeon]
MLSYDIVFIFVAGIAFLGFILNALFDKINITSILPLMLIGLLIGPVFHVVDTGAGSTIADLTPYVTALAVSFILFDVGINLRINKLKSVFAKATSFTFELATATGIVVGIVTFFAFHYTLGWSVADAFIFSFALSGPSSVIVPTLVKVIKVNDDLKTTLVYESVASDTLELIIPILLLDILASASITGIGIASLIVSAVVGSIVFGLVSAVFWLFILNKFKAYSESYSWMLTIAMVIATYGIATLLGFNGAITIFVFGILFSNIGSVRPSTDPVHEPTFVERYLAIPYSIDHIKDYQKEIVFFTSTFFFVYIGMLFTFSGVYLDFIVFAIMITFVIMLVRFIGSGLLKQYLSNDKKESVIQRNFISYNVARGLSPAIVATLPLTYGIVIPGFLDSVFLVILITNIASTAGIFMAYRKKPVEVVKNKQNAAVQA